jgi:NADH-quinone oxidoreductase subunit C
MTPEQIAEHLKSRFADKITGGKFQTALPHITVDAAAWPDVAMYLRNDPKLVFNVLRCITAVDLLEDDKLAAIYDLDSYSGEHHGRDLWQRRHTVTIKVIVPRKNPHIPTVSHVWPAADWHEREAYDLMGIIFDNHPDSVEGPEGLHPRRILCADDWEGHPLRKDYIFPMEYHDIPAVTEYGQTRPAH